MMHEAFVSELVPILIPHVEHCDMCNAINRRPMNEMKISVFDSSIDYIQYK